MSDSESEERTIGCLPGDTPAGTVMMYQELRHREALATRDAEIRELRTEMESAIERAASANEWWSEARRVILDKDAEIERLKAEVASWRRVLEDMTIERNAERALREKRERQIVWAVNHRAIISTLPSLAMLEYSAEFGSQITIPFDNTDSGLLAAIDEVCP